jgi:ribosomal protein S16
MRNPKRLRPIDAVTFFKCAFPGCSMSDAHHDTRIAYPIIHSIAHNGASPTQQIGTLLKLSTWSKNQAAAHGLSVYIGIEESVSSGEKHG